MLTTDIDVHEVLSGAGHGPPHHHRPTGVVGRVSLWLVDGSMRRPKGADRSRRDDARDAPAS